MRRGPLISGVQYRTIPTTRSTYKNTASCPVMPPSRCDYCTIQHYLDVRCKPRPILHFPLCSRASPSLNELLQSFFRVAGLFHVLQSAVRDSAYEYRRSKLRESMRGAGKFTPPNMEDTMGAICCTKLGAEDHCQDSGGVVRCGGDHGSS